ncbi:TPA: hypothetical protein ACGO1T_001474 [Streptococcus suis]
MKKWMEKVVLMALLMGMTSNPGQAKAVDRSLIDMQAAYDLLFAPDFDGEVMSQAEADAVIEAIIADLDANYMHYSKANRQAFYNAVESHIPGFRMGAVYKTMPDYFVAYVDALIAESGASTGPQLSSSQEDYSVDVSLFDSIVDFHLLRPTYRHLQMSTSSNELNFQGSILDDSANYTYYSQELPNQIISVLSSDGSGVREVTVSTNIVVEGLNANYHYGTDQAFLFHNAQGGISLAYPDVTGLLQHMDQPVWLEYRLVGNYDTGMKMIDPQDMAQGRPEFDPSRQWWDLLARMDAEFTVAHVVSPQSVLLEPYNFHNDPVFTQWYNRIFLAEPTLHEALEVYDHTFAYEIVKSGYSQEEATLANLVRVRAYDFIRRGESEMRYEQGLRTAKVALADRLYQVEKLQADPVLAEIMNQIAVTTGMTLQGRDLISLDQEGSLIKVGLGVVEPIASGYPVFVYDLATGQIYNDLMGGQLELFESNIFSSNYGVDVNHYQSDVAVPADYVLNQELVQSLLYR